MKGTVHAGDSRQVSAAVAAAVIRTLTATSTLQFADEADETVASLVQGRLDLIRPVFVAQTKQALSTGAFQHSANGLLEPHMNFLANCAKHMGFKDKEPFSSYTVAELKAKQRGGRKKAVIPLAAKSIAGSEFDDTIVGVGSGGDTGRETGS